MDTGHKAQTPVDDSRAQALALIERAKHLSSTGHIDQAGDLIGRALSLARRCDDRQVLGWALMEEGWVAYCAGRPLAAYTASSEACRLLADCNDVERHAQALNTCALVYISSDDLAGRVELLRKGLRLADRPEHWATRCRLLHNLSIGLSENGEHAEAIECLNEAVGVAKRADGFGRRWEAMASRLAFTHLQYADHLNRNGNGHLFRIQLDAAAAALPSLSAECWQGADRDSFVALWAQVEVLACLQRWNSARPATAACIRFARRSRQNLVNLGWALTALAALYRRQEQLQRSIRADHRALAVWRRANYQTEVIACLGRLSDLHARAGSHAAALALRKEMAAHQSRRRREAGALRCRLAAIEQQAERRRRQTQEATLHAGRLAIVGRLIAQTHHALSAPIACTQRLTARALISALRADALRPLLAEVNQAMDRAAGLVSQLKLFSYRSLPQPMALSLHESLLDAWQGMDAHIGSRGADLHISGHTQLQVWGDAQRLGIMLKVLLIELTQQAGAGGAAVAIGAGIAAGDAHSVLLHIEAFGDPPLPAADQPPAASLGAALCMEIAAEMHGQLTSIADGAAVLRYRLRLPEAEAHRHTVGGLMAQPQTLLSGRHA